MNYQVCRSVVKCVQTITIPIENMKSTIMAGILGAVIAITAFLLISPLMPQQAKAAELGSGEQYKLVNGNQFLGQPSLYEQELNQLGSQGWKVRCSAGQYVIMVK
jgi:hypothetical protein